ncbi:MAG TPA: hypothetical protein VF771_03230 [Longimicrobiaceae bacterium]
MAEPVLLLCLLAEVTSEAEAEEEMRMIAARTESRAAVARRTVEPCWNDRAYRDDHPLPALRGAHG